MTSNDDINEIKVTLAQIKERQESFLSLAQETKDGLWKNVEPRVRHLENWRWFIVGGLGLLGFIVAHDLLKPVDKPSSKEDRRSLYAEHVQSKNSTQN